MIETEKWMTQALKLAERGRGHVHPNPMVGCVVVRSKKLVAEGFHRRFGGPHAEVEALRDARSMAKGATLYVNLEPCAYWGKTPPCVDAIRSAGVRHVVAAMRDPNPRVAGKGFLALRRWGITSEVGVMQQAARELNRGFLSWMIRGRPWVTAKAATSLDGKVATSSGESKWITGKLARRRGYALRAQADAVAIGIETVLQDNPSLTSHGFGPNPLRVIFDSRLRIPMTARILNGQSPRFILTTGKASDRKRKALETKGIAVEVCASDPAGKVSIPDALKRLSDRGVARLLVEGGGQLIGSFFSNGCVDEVAWFVAPLLIGGEGRNAVGGSSVPRLADAWHLVTTHVEPIGSDYLLNGRTVVGDSLLKASH